MVPALTSSRWGRTTVPIYTLIVPPSIQTYADLRGRRLAVAGVTDPLNVILIRMLDANGLQPADYDLVPVGGTPERLAAVQGGAVSREPPHPVRRLQGDGERHGPTGPFNRLRRPLPVHRNDRQARLGAAAPARARALSARLREGYPVLLRPPEPRGRGPRPGRADEDGTAAGRAGLRPLSADQEDDPAARRGRRGGGTRSWRRTGRRSACSRSHRRSIARSTSATWKKRRSKAPAPPHPPAASAAPLSPPGRTPRAASGVQSARPYGARQAARGLGSDVAVLQVVAHLARVALVRIAEAATAAADEAHDVAWLQDLVAVARFEPALVRRPADHPGAADRPGWPPSRPGLRTRWRSQRIDERTARRPVARTRARCPGRRGTGPRPPSPAPARSAAGGRGTRSRRSRSAPSAVSQVLVDAPDTPSFARRARRRRP